MSLFTRKEKEDEELMKLYEKYIVEGMRPEKAARKAREELEK